jgi:hypothetical protein
MSKQPPQKPGGQQPAQIQIADNIPGAEYANLAQINHNREEFQLIFINILGNTGRVVGKIITNPGHFKRMIAAMQDNLKKYEDRFGEIKEIAGEEKEIGFKP